MSSSGCGGIKGLLVCHASQASVGEAMARTTMARTRRARWPARTLEVVPATWGSCPRLLELDVVTIPYIQSGREWFVFFFFNRSLFSSIHSVHL